MEKNSTYIMEKIEKLNLKMQIEFVKPLGEWEEVYSSSKRERAMCAC